MPPKKSKKSTVPQANINQLRKKSKSERQTQTKLNSYEMFRQFRGNGESNCENTTSEQYMKQRKVQIAQRILKLRGQRSKIKAQQFTNMIKLLRSVRVEPDDVTYIEPDYVRYYLAQQLVEKQNLHDVSLEYSDQLTDIILLKKCNLIQSKKNQNKVDSEYQNIDVGKENQTEYITVETQIEENAKIQYTVHKQ